MSTLSSWLILIALCAFVTALVASGVAAMVAGNAAYKGVPSQFKQRKVAA